MPTRKQRRREQKLRRHEYEEVWVDEHGNEVQVDPAAVPEPANERNGSRPAAARAGARTIQPPSWRRVGKRTLIFAPIMFVVITLIYSGELSPVSRVLLTLQMLLLFVPFSYLMDSLFYRAHQRRLARAQAGGTATRRR